MDRQPAHAQVGHSLALRRWRCQDRGSSGFSVSRKALIFMAML
jgi:hypothetical protein